MALAPTTNAVWPKQRNRFCLEDYSSLICAIVRWKERHPSTIVTDIECWEEGKNIWCELTWIDPWEE